MKYKLHLTTLFITFWLYSCGGSTDTPKPEVTEVEVTEPEETESEETESEVDYGETALLFGRWIFVNSGEELYISPNNLVTYTKIDDDLIRVVRDDSTEMYAMRAGTSKATVKGRLKTVSSEDQGSSKPTRAVANNSKGKPSKTSKPDTDGIANINIIIKNIVDSDIEEETTTDEDGNFDVDDLPAGEYEIVIGDDDVTQIITVDDEDENLGDYTIVDDEVNNFKVSLAMDDRFQYADNKQYQGTFSVANVGQATSVGASYQVTLEHESLEYFTHTITLGSILPNDSKEIPFTFRFSAIDTDEFYTDIPINISISDISGRNWDETFNIRLYKEKLYISVLADAANIKGYIVLPFSDKVIPIDTQRNSVSLPKISEEYRVLLSNPNIEEETVYSLAVYRSANVESGFNDPSRYEPNDEQSQAETIEPGDVVTSYMHIGDLDYWKVSLDSDTSISTNPTTYEEIVANGTYTDNGSYYYLNLPEDSNVTFSAQSYAYSWNIYDINLKRIQSVGGSSNGTGIYNMLLNAGEYLLQPIGTQSLYTLQFNSELDFPEITSSGTYTDNGSYYYLNLPEDSNVTFSAQSYAYSWNIYDINLKRIQSVGGSSNGTGIYNMLLNAGEYLLQPIGTQTISLPF